MWSPTSILPCQVCAQGDSSRESLTGLLQYVLFSDVGPHSELGKYNTKQEVSSLQSHCKQASTQETFSAPDLIASKLFPVL